MNLNITEEMVSGEVTGVPAFPFLSENSQNYNIQA